MIFGTDKHAGGRAMDWADCVGREEFLGRILAGDVGTGAFHEVRGVVGAGKSVLLSEAARRAEQEHVVVLVDAKDHVPASGQLPTGDGRSDPRGEAHRFGRILADVLGALWDRPPEVAKILAGMLDDIGRLRLDGGQGFDDRGSDDRVRGGAAGSDAEDLAGEVQALVTRVQDGLNALVDLRAAQGRRVFLFVDTFDVFSRPLRGWFLDLLGGLPAAVVVVAHATSARPAQNLPGATSTIELGGLTQSQVRDYLVGRLEPAAGADLAPAVFALTEGHPLTVGLTADLILLRRRNEEPTTTVDLQNMITRMSSPRSDVAGRSRRLVKEFLEVLKEYDPPAHRGLECMCAVRRFDFPLLENLLMAAGGSASAGVSDLAERLTEYSFVEPRTPPDRPGNRYYVVHAMVRNHTLEKIVTPSRQQALHLAAEKYYQDVTAQFQDDYEGWFRYEDPQWQTMIREWLYHVAHLDNKSSGSSRLGLARLFLDAFWWWGNYTPFNFCEQLLADWTETAQLRADRLDLTWGRYLAEVYARYPKGWQRKAADPADWRTIHQLLLYFWDWKDLKGRNLTEEKVRHVRGLLAIYLADAKRHLDPHDPKVTEYLDEARDHFAANDDNWNVAWTACEQADAALGRGDARAALSALSREVGALEELGDSELTATMHRIHGDAVWLQGEHDLALDCHARAALHAYRLQVVSIEPDIPPTDTYTQAFLVEMHERSAARLTELHQLGDDDSAYRACARIRRFFAPYWGDAAPADLRSLLTAGRIDDVVRHLLPLPPAASDLDQPGTTYTRVAGEVLHHMEQELAQPPGTPLPQE